MKAICIKRYFNIKFGELVHVTTGSATITRASHYNVIGKYRTYWYLSIFIFKEHFRRFI